MTKKEFTDYLFKIMYELGYRKAEVAKGGVFFYKCDTLMTTWTPRVPTECTCFPDKWQCIDICEYLDIVDWESVEVDTPILVGNDNKTWFKRYFAKYEDGKVYAWLNGKTSWSSTCEVSIGHWKYAKLVGGRA